MAQARGQLTVVLDGRTTERDTLTCAHCNLPYVMPPKPAPPAGGFCRTCMGATCERCSTGACTPWTRRMDVAEKKGQSRDRIERALKGEL
ncbi:MAG: hypothetical protein AAB721_02835 [Patescibacteria group bacterium]